MIHRLAGLASHWQVRLGGITASDPDPDVVYANVSRVIPYPYFDTAEATGDVGLLELFSPVTYTDTIVPICLPSRDVDTDQFKVCVDTGFGTTDYSGWQYFVCYFLVLKTTFYQVFL